MENKSNELEYKSEEMSSKKDDESSHEENESDSERVAEIIACAKKRYLSAIESESEMRKTAYDDLKFRAGYQWPEEVLNDRRVDGRPIITVNRIPQFIRQVTNDQRQNRPQIKVHPVDDNADIETAKIYQGIIKHIEVNSNADNAYDCAFEGASIKGFGYFYITIDWVSPTSFDQEIFIKKIRNHFNVCIDPASKELDGSDMEWGMIFDDILKEDYEEEYKESELSQMRDWTSIGDSKDDWVTKERCRIAHYWFKQYRKATLCLLSTGQVIEKDDLDTIYPEGYPDSIKIVTQREASIPEVKYCKINGVEILEETDWPGRFIPIVPVFGDEIDIDGKRVVEGILRHSKDSQRMLNYYKSNEAESIALAPKAPFIVAEGQIPKSYEVMWRTANRKNYAYLPYKPVSFNGQMAPPPQRNAVEPAVGAITNASMMAADDLKATTGIYDAALGARSGETSGIAIQRRNMQSQTSNFHLMDNLNTSIRQAGKILLDLIRKVYDGERTAMILGEDGQRELIRINQEFQRNGKNVKYQLDVGQYDVIVEAGPSFATRRMEAAASMENMTQKNPQLMGIVGDLILKNMDWPGSTEMADRLRKTIPPQYLDDDKGMNPLQMKSQMDQMSQLLEQLTQKLNESNKIIEQKTIEIESKERIAFAEMQTELQKEAMKNHSLGAIDSLNKQIAQIQQRLMLLDFNKPFDTEMNESIGMNSPGGQNSSGLNGPYSQPTGGMSPGKPMEF